ncbi:MULTISPECIES: competence protein CoiA family protein [Winogradskyella]|uniref:competence protein CoiA family protein n=1 Tax=Winogradskyella TaxID=286104 RepID=UPI0015CCD6F2|nr:MULTISPECIES: competence protein CoiA family protein [Winogradskyella]QXP78436.1 hypothetical protein H0I32_14640 [Winogradskyella sp. HaHa_3_26]
MKNLYALNEKKCLIHIGSAKKELKEKYTCCNCGSELIARKGKIKAHHFSHKSEGNCSYESYLHKVSKIKFHEIYTQCLKNKKPFYVEYKTKLTCVSCKTIDNINIECKLKDKIGRFDLTKYFDKISIEKGVNGFIADVLLKSSLKGDEILIEFAVTHKCEEKKLQSGLRIIEIQLKNENDLKFIDFKYISLSNKNIELFNFNVNHKIDQLIKPRKCNQKFEFFSILKDNTAMKVKKTMSNIILDIEEDKYKHFEVLKKQEDEYTGLDFIDLVKDYADKDKSFKNCYACRFAVKRNRPDTYSDLVCKRMRQGIRNSNTGSNCDKYWKFQSPYLQN